MAGGMVTTASKLLCPHGASITVTSSSVTTAGGAPIATAADTFVIAGCPFMKGNVASPCVKVVWSTAGSTGTIDGKAVLSETSAGTCYSADQLPQGKVAIAATSPAVVAG